MKENMLDTVSRKIQSRQEAVSRKLTETFSGQKPFGQIEYRPEELIYHFSNLSETDVQELAAKYGGDVVFPFIGNLAAKKQKLGM
jgi:hypothetical protein